ncbi:hypothetical protein OAT67_08285 [Bacteriovoracaceae bacterium]|nr:hypothetical protein [Bacteriovoracaceae bacterium]|tara:strand:- start:29899 stop:30651 length:753 start_codon:yes stop_codon:yes gene_type:complete
MKALLVFITSILSISAFSITTIEFSCSAPDIPYKYRFNLKGSVEIYTELNEETSARFYSSVMTQSLTKAGNNQTTVTSNAAVTGVVKYFPPGIMTKEEFILIQGLPKDNDGTFYNLALNFPGKFSSKIRTKEGFEYASECKTIAKKTCLFGSDLGELSDSERFTSKKLPNLFTQSRVYEGTKDEDADIGFKPLVARTVYTDKVTGESYTLFYTFDDEYDGGNTIGWIEDANGNKVASIGDSDIYTCQKFQ